MNFSFQDIIIKLRSFLKVIGLKTSYIVLLLFFAYERKDTPTWAKNIILGSLTYFLSPIDGVPDLTPFIGFTDDMGVLSFGLVSIACYINDDVREKASSYLNRFFKKVNVEVLEEVDSWL